MLASQGCDLVCIPTPSDNHAEMALAALDAGTPVLCEKPTGMNAEEARAMRDRAGELDRVALIVHKLRFNSSHIKLAELVRSGANGEVRHAPISNMGSVWANPAGRPKGLLVVACCAWWGGLRRQWMASVRSPSLVVCRGEFGGRRGQTLHRRSGRSKDWEPWGAAADDFVQISLCRERVAQDVMMISGVARHGLDNLTCSFGSERTLILDNSDESLLLERGSGDFEDLSEPDPNSGLSGMQGVWNVSSVGLMRELTAAILEGHEVRAGATFEDAYRNQLVLDAVLASNHYHRWVDLNSLD